MHVTLAGNIFDYLDYQAPTFDLALGVRVQVLFRGKLVIGLVTGRRTEPTLSYGLLPIVAVLDSSPIISQEMLTRMSWLSNYYQCALSEVYASMLPKLLRQGDLARLPLETYYELSDEGRQPLAKRMKKQQACLDYLARMVAPASKRLCHSQGFLAGTLKPLRDKNKIIRIERECLPALPSKQPEHALTLNDEQQYALHLMSPSLAKYKAFLLFGVTGSGKTEVYFQVMEQMLAKGKQVLILVPEIGLTPQFVSRVARRFTYPVALLHSKLSDKERLLNWLWCKETHAKIVIGTRTSVFTPLPKLGLIIVDEEHDQSFKQQSGMRFSARDVALKRGFDAKIPVILGSATPSLESMANAQNGKYTLLTLKQRAATKEKTFYRVMDLRNQRILDGLCGPTMDRIKAHLTNKQQVLVFINRRGFAPILICHQCGWMADCKNCSAHLTVHGREQSMQCHHCGYKRPLARSCDTCHSTELIPVGAGTERLTGYLSEAFPAHKVLRVDKDTTSGKGRLQDALQSIESGDVDILVGTQLLAKGHHFKKLTLVVVVDADAGFYSQDFRSIERLGQVVTQVAGRAGREGGGEVVIQTHHPDNPLLNVLVQKGYGSFCQTLLKERKDFHWPPFSFLALCRAQGRNAEQVIAFFMSVKQYLRSLDESFTLLGPAPAPMEKRAGQFQLQLLIRSKDRFLLLRALKSLRLMLRSKGQRKLVANLRFSIDVDPQDLS